MDKSVGNPAYEKAHDDEWNYGDSVISQIYERKDEKRKSKEVVKPAKKKKVTITRDAESEFNNEVKIRESEKRSVENEWMTNPTSVSDFERLVMTKGSSSVVWIGYMAYHLNNGDLEMARKTVRRGLDRIDFREMVEKRNLWLAFLNMECLYGDNVMSVFDESLQYNDPKIMYQKMVNIFIANKMFDEAKEICVKAVKKFGNSKKIWLMYIRLLYKDIGDCENGREVYKTCIGRIPQHKRISVTSAVALLEYKHGSPEIGKIHFENTLLENPKRMDIWMQYICAHIKLHINDTTKSQAERLKSIRNLFDRIISLDLKPKKMKIIFSKWLEFECTHGNDKSKEMVQKKALKYVEYIEKNLIN